MRAELARVRCRPDWTWLRRGGCYRERRQQTHSKSECGHELLEVAFVHFCSTPWLDFQRLAF